MMFLVRLGALLACALSLAALPAAQGTMGPTPLAEAEGALTAKNHFRWEKGFKAPGPVVFTIISEPPDAPFQALAYLPDAEEPAAAASGKGKLELRVDAPQGAKVTLAVVGSTKAEVRLRVQVRAV